MLHCRTASRSLRLGNPTRCCALASNNPSDRPCISRLLVREFKEQTRSRLRVFGVACEVRIAPQKKLARPKVATPKRSCQCHRPSALEVGEQAHQDDVVGCGPLANNSADTLTVLTSGLATRHKKSNVATYEAQKENTPGEEPTFAISSVGGYGLATLENFPVYSNSNFATAFAK